MTKEEIALVLSKLRIRSGLASKGRKWLDKSWAVDFFYDRDAEQFAAKLFYKTHGKIRDSVMGLSREHDVETRGKSQWMTDNTWRLTPAGVDKVALSIVKVMGQKGERT